MAQTTMKQLNDRFEITESENTSTVWRYFDSPEGPTWKVYVEDSTFGRQIRNWQGIGPGAVYFRPDGHRCGQDFIVPKRLLKRALKLIGIQFRKQMREPTTTQLESLRQGRETLVAQFQKVGDFT